MGALLEAIVIGVVGITADVQTAPPEEPKKIEQVCYDNGYGKLCKPIQKESAKNG